MALLDQLEVCEEARQLLHRITPLECTIHALPEAPARRPSCASSTSTVARPSETGRQSHRTHTRAPARLSYHVGGAEIDGEYRRTYSGFARVFNPKATPEDAFAEVIDYHANI